MSAPFLAPCLTSVSGGATSGVSAPRGSTVQFATNFFDVDGNISQPDGAEVHILSPNATGQSDIETIIEMTPPTIDESRWTAFFDTRGSFPGTVFWSIHTITPIGPVSVEDGAFTLTANAANLPTF